MRESAIAIVTIAVVALVLLLLAVIIFGAGILSFITH
jgi:hypothetical protein